MPIDSHTECPNCGYRYNRQSAESCRYCALERQVERLEERVEELEGDDETIEVASTSDVTVAVEGSGEW